MSSIILREKSSKLHPLHLSFLDPEEEVEYKHHFYEESIRYIQMGFLILLFLLAFFGLIEWLLLPELSAKFWKIRYGLTIPGYLCFAPFFFTKRAQPFTKKHLQNIIFVAILWIYLTFVWMGVLLLSNAKDTHLFYGTQVYILVNLGVYIGTRMKVTHAALLSVCTLLSCVLLTLFYGQQRGLFLFNLASFGMVANIIGLFATYQLEQSMRIRFSHQKMLKAERARAEELLLNILPAEIALRLQKQEEPIADSFESVSVLFADIVGFTKLSQELSPDEIVSMLDQLFAAFDRLTQTHQIEKIKTIGDAYMVAAGIPQPRDDHAVILGHMALDMQRALQQHSPKGTHLSLRIGIHSGSVVAGVIGLRKFSYDLWGDTVNTASRMESHGEPHKIQISQDVAELVQDHFELEERGEIEIKGKGPMKTWWLLSTKKA